MWQEECNVRSTRHRFFFNDTATTEIYTLSLHDALPIYAGEQRGHPHHEERGVGQGQVHLSGVAAAGVRQTVREEDRKSTRLNSSHANISYAVFCLKKKIEPKHIPPSTTVDSNDKRTCIS